MLKKISIITCLSLLISTVSPYIALANILPVLPVPVAPVNFIQPLNFFEVAPRAKRYLGFAEETKQIPNAALGINDFTNLRSLAIARSVRFRNHFTNGNVERVERQASDPVGTWQVTQFTYDTLNNLKTITDPLSRVTILNYDLSENLASSIDAETNTTTYVYDERDLLFTVTDANTPAGVTTYDYDNNGNLAKITDANLNLTTYTYDLYDRLDTMTYADSSVVDYDFDKNSNLDFVTLPGTHGTIDYGYDVLNRLTTVDYGSGTPDKLFDYDLGSRLTDADAGTVLNDFTYDNLNRVKTNTQTLNAVAYTLTYNYEDNGNRKDLTYPSTKFVEYTYDLHNRLDLVKVGGNTLVDYNYDPLDRRDTKTFALSPTPLATSYQFDIANQLGSITNTILPSTNISTYSYPVYDNVSNRKQMDFTLQAGTPVTTNYVYNTIYELTSVTGAQTHSYDYDSVGNREVADSVTYTPNNLNQYTQVGATTYAYDNNGNLTSDGTNTYTYDEENRLTTFTNGIDSASYAYDAFNRRVSKTVNGTTTYFVYDNDSVIAEYDGSGALQAEYVLGDQIDEVLTMNRNSTDYYYHYDGLGSVSQITDGAGSILESYIYDVYGNVEIFDGLGMSLGQSSAIGNRFMFTGQEFDEETGLYHYNARTYNSLIGRFHQRDPIGYYDSINLFAYVRNNPINYVDPSGKIIANLIAGGVGSLLGGTIGAITSLMNDQDVGTGIIVGAVAGGLSGVSFGTANLGSMALVGAIAGASANYSGQVEKNFSNCSDKPFSDIDYLSLGYSAFSGAVTSYVVGILAPELGIIEATTAGGGVQFLIEVKPALLNNMYQSIKK